MLPETVACGAVFFVNVTFLTDKLPGTPDFTKSFTQIAPPNGFLLPEPTPYTEFSSNVEFSMIKSLYTSMAPP